MVSACVQQPWKSPEKFGWSKVCVSNKLVTSVLVSFFLSAPGNVRIYSEFGQDSGVDAGKPNAGETRHDRTSCFQQGCVCGARVLGPPIIGGLWSFFIILAQSSVFP